MTDAMTLPQRADALEDKMAAGARLHRRQVAPLQLAEGDIGPPPNAGAIMKANPNARVLMGDDPRLPAMPEKPTLIDFFKYRFGPSHAPAAERHATR